MLKIWGRADGSNVIKAMWCIGELGIAHERIDWGGEFGGNDDPEYRRKNPNGRLPTLEEEDGWTLWESGAVVRDLCMKHSLGNLCPDTPRGRADAEKWMDWSSLNFAGFNGVYLQHYFGPEDKRNHNAILAAAKDQVKWLDILDRHLAGRQYLCGERLTMADIPARNELSDALSQDLRKRGFNFVGSTICYAFMQAVGMVNDHALDCFRYGGVGRSRRRSAVP